MADKMNFEFSGDYIFINKDEFFSTEFKKRLYENRSQNSFLKWIVAL